MSLYLAGLEGLPQVVQESELSLAGGALRRERKDRKGTLAPTTFNLLFPPVVASRESGAVAIYESCSFIPARFAFLRCSFVPNPS